MIYFIDPGFSSEHILSEYQKINSLDWRKEPDERGEPEEKIEEPNSDYNWFENEMFD